MQRFTEKQRRATPLNRIGVVGGGQLGRMMIYRAKKLGMEVSILDPSEDAPAARMADRFVRGSLYDEKAIRELAASCDVLTYEIEHLDAEALARLESEGYTVHPAPSVLKTIQDKLVQKTALRDAGVAVPEFASIARDLATAREQIRAFGLPCVLKQRRGGYDGHGVSIVGSVSEIPQLITDEAMVESLVQIRMELSVLIARSTTGEIATYPLVGMRFRKHAHVLEWLEAPAEVEPAIAERARSEARRAVEALGGTGIFAVELFVDESNNILVNEIAPRPHNSGHFTIEACYTDQFEQHLRAICGLPLGATNELSAAVMINLLGEPGFRGTPIVEGLDEILAVPGVQYHWYGKSETRPHRKMGHVTVLAPDLERARAIAARVQATIRITGESTDG